MVDKLTQTQIGKKADIPTGQPKRIAVIDDFSNNSVFIDEDAKPDIPHGQVVSRIIREGLPNAKIKPFEIGSENERYTLTNNALDKILQDIDKGEKYDALNFSNAYFCDFNILSKLMHKKITQSNLKDNKSEIKNWFSRTAQGEQEQQIAGIIHKLEKVSNKGVKVYISAGNKEPKSLNHFNLFTLANNVKNVGAFDSKGKKAKFSYDNSLVNSWAKGEFQIKKLKDKQGNVGFDYTGDGTVDLFVQSTTSGKQPSPDNLKGTSIAAPYLLAKENKN